MHTPERCCCCRKAAAVVNDALVSASPAVMCVASNGKLQSSKQDHNQLEQSRQYAHEPVLTICRVLTSTLGNFGILTGFVTAHSRCVSCWFCALTGNTNACAARQLKNFMRHDLLRHVQLKHSNSISALQQKGLPIVKTAERQNPPFKAYSRRVYVRTAERQHSPFKP